MITTMSLVADFQIPSFFSFGYFCRTLKAPNTRKFLEVHKQNTTEKNIIRYKYPVPLRNELPDSFCDSVVWRSFYLYNLMKNTLYSSDWNCPRKEYN